VAVPCPGCGRQYDVTLFEFGRTLWCTCGSRVGRETRARRLDAAAGARFIADAMLGRLARWLRLLGFDCAWEAHIPDERLVRRGVDEGRVILSRDRALADEWRVSELHLLQAEKVRDQLVEVVRRFDLAPDIRLLTRCSECNEPLAPLPAALAAERVPARVLERQRRFSGCPACERVYWEGTHTDRIKRFVDGIVAEASGAPG